MVHDQHEKQNQEVATRIKAALVDESCNWLSVATILSQVPQSDGVRLATIRIAGTKIGDDVLDKAEATAKEISDLGFIASIEPPEKQETTPEKLRVEPATFWIIVAAIPSTLVLFNNALKALREIPENVRALLKILQGHQNQVMPSDLLKVAAINTWLNQRYGEENWTYDISKCRIIRIDDWDIVDLEEQRSGKHFILRLSGTDIIDLSTNSRDSRK